MNKIIVSRHLQFIMFTRKCIIKTKYKHTFIKNLAWTILIIIFSNKVEAQQKVLNFSLYENSRMGPILMESTFYLYDPSDLKNAGTSFVLAHITEVDTLTKYPDSTYYNTNKSILYNYSKFRYVEVLITTAHFLKSIKGDSVNIVLRKKINNKYETFDFSIQIRKNGEKLWSQVNNEVDVAAMVVSLPEEATYSILTDNNLADSKTINNLDVNTGDDISCLGFPFNTPSNIYYFPILRSGKYASFRNKEINEDNFLFDFRIYPGNSGGPVFIDLKIYVNSIGNLMNRPAILLGMVSEQIKSMDGQTLEVSKVMSAQSIIETISSITNVSNQLLKNYNSKTLKE